MGGVGTAGGFEGAAGAAGGMGGMGMDAADGMDAASEAGSEHGGDEDGEESAVASSDQDEEDSYDGGDGYGGGGGGGGSAVHGSAGVAGAPQQQQSEGEGYGVDAGFSDVLIKPRPSTQEYVDALVALAESSPDEVRWKAWDRHATQGCAKHAHARHVSHLSAQLSYIAYQGNATAHGHQMDLQNVVPMRVLSATAHGHQMDLQNMVTMHVLGARIGLFWSTKGAVDAGIMHECDWGWGCL
eukprot:13011-Pelagomonas_calceolata.AAC.4